jgi:hypothetical protein
LKIFQITLFAACLLLLGNRGLAAVVINSPYDGATVSSPVQVNASVRGQQPIFVSVYVDDVLIVHRQGVTQLRTPINLGPGTYTIKVLAQYSYRSSEATSSIIVAATGTSAPPSSPAPPGMSAAAQISADMQGNNEGHPHGVPSYFDFYTGPFIVMGNQPAGNKAVALWGGLYIDSGGNPATNTRVNIRNCQLYWKRASTGAWTRGVLTNTPEVGSYAEDFSQDFGLAAVRTESDGTISFTAGGGRVSHFYAPYPRIPIDPNDFGGVVSVCEARLILNNPNGPDDRAIAKYLLDTGADYYPDTTGPGIENNPGIGGGKLKYVTTDWRSFAMSTLTQNQLDSNPPPINLGGVLP